jgi:hypothetical protein
MCHARATYLPRERIPGTLRSSDDACASSTRRPSSTSTGERKRRFEIQSNNYPPEPANPHFDPCYFMRNASLTLAFIISLIALPSCASTVPQKERMDQPVADNVPPLRAKQRPEWLRFVVGQHAYAIDGKYETLLVCSTLTDYSLHRDSKGNHCVERSAGDLVTIHRIYQHGGDFGAPVYVVANTWQGLISEYALVARVPKGTTIRCGENLSDWSLKGKDYSEERNVGRSAFKAIVVHTLTRTEGLGPYFRIVSGPARGLFGYLTFSELQDKCNIDGTKYNLTFEPDDEA